MLERFFTFIRSLGHAAIAVQERRAQVRLDVYATPWETTTGEIPIAG